MKIARIKRTESTEQGTFGKLTIDGEIGYVKFTGELPWYEGKHQISCIPTGEYTCQPSIFKGHPRYLLTKVKDDTGHERAGIFIHEINYVGDESKGFKTDSHGCIGIGNDIKYDDRKQKLIVGYYEPIREFMEKINGKEITSIHDMQEFKLVIT